MADEFKDRLGDDGEPTESGWEERLKPGGPSPESMVKIATVRLAVVEDAIKGLSPRELGEKYNLSATQIGRILKEIAQDVRRRARDLVDHAFHMQSARLERLYKLVEYELQAYEMYMEVIRGARAAGENVTPVRFDDRPFRIAVMIFDRQAKLLGLDTIKDKDKSRGEGAWLEGAPIDEVVAYAKQLKMKIPTEFET